MSGRTERDGPLRFCSDCARHAGLDAAGSAYSYDHLLAVEIPLPWPLSMYSEPGVLPRELVALRAELVAAYQRGETMRLGALAIAPEPAYSVAGYRRVISYRRPDGLFARFAQHEYLVPEAETGPLCWALLFDHAALSRFDGYLLPGAPTRDLMVCTHGNVDAACAKYGFPLYRQLQQITQAGAGVRVWRVSHFGGHVFAPTLLDMPECRYWAYVDAAVAEHLVARSGDPAALRQHYRGWAGLTAWPLQVADRELFMRHGWAWNDYLKSGQVLEYGPPEQASEPDWAEVRIDYVAPCQNVRGAYTARVEQVGRTECIANSGDAEPYSFPRYQVVRLDHHPVSQETSVSRGVS